MALERKDVRAKLHPNVHRMLQAVAKQRGLTDAELVEEILVPEIMRRIHDAIALADEARASGITGNFRESPGATGKGVRG
jgi:hypothetical protein